MNLIEERLYLGDAADARAFLGERLSVLETAPDYPLEGRTYHIPILTVPANHNAATPLWASRKQLDKCVTLISERLAAGAALLVHCGAGIERSPLTLAYWLVKSGRCPTLDTAYTLLLARRECVLDRHNWLEPGEKL